MAAASTASVQVSQGAVDLSVSPSADGTSSDYTVSFRGRITDHGWSHSGTMTAVGSTWRWSASMDRTPILSVTSDDGAVSGTCLGSSAAADGAAGVPTTALDMDFGCVLSRGGGTPWQITLRSALTQGAGDTWSGSYVETDAAAQVTVPHRGVTYGDAQFGDFSSFGALELGPLRLSGQIDIGGTLYRGDLVSGVSGRVTGLEVPPLAMSGSSNGVDVSGTCNGVADDLLGQVGISSYEFTCSLAVGTAPAVTVAFRTVFTSRIGGCSDRDCWGDSAGYFTAG